MLSSKDLRVDNITLDINGEYYLVKPNSFVTVADNSLTLFGVELTGEILQAYGYIQNQSHINLYHYGNYKVDVERKRFTIISTPNNDYHTYDCKYLHELQNIHLALYKNEPQKPANTLTILKSLTTKN